MTTEDGKAEREIQVQLEREQQRQQYYITPKQYEEMRKRSGFVLRKRTFLVLLALVGFAFFAADQALAEEHPSPKEGAGFSSLCPKWERDRGICK